jgi:N-acetylmuramoyl-L-alanine amidase
MEEAGRLFMRRFHMVILLMLCSAAEPAGILFAAPNRSAPSGEVRFEGKPYTAISDWADEHHFEIHWPAANKIELVNRQTRLWFQADGRDIDLNGVRVGLAYPVVFRGREGYVSKTDVQVTINPTLFPVKNASAKKISTIVLDPGHGGNDSGNHTASHSEKTYTLLLAQELRRQLTQAGFEVFLTRTTDTYVDLPTRPEIAQRHNADLFISLHWNDLPNDRSVRGSQVYCLTPAGASSSNGGHILFGGLPQPGNRNDSKNLLLAYLIQRSLVGNLHVEDRGVRRARYWVLRNATMPAVLIEGGFMSNPADARNIYDAGFRSRMAEAIAKGIMAYKSQVEFSSNPG